MTTVLPSGHWPLTAAHDHLTTQLHILDDASATPTGITTHAFLPHYPTHPHLSLLPRTLSTLAELNYEHGPHGWKLAPHAGHDAHRVTGELADQLDALTIAGHTATTPFTLTVLGPLTLATRLWLHHGDRALADHGAIRDIASALGEGLSHTVTRIGALIPRSPLHLQVDESDLAATLTGLIPTFSGHSRIRAVDPALAVEVLHRTLDPIAQVVPVTVHTGDSWVGIPTAARVLADLGSPAHTVHRLGVALGPWNERLWEHVATVVEHGVGFHAGLPTPVMSSCAGTDVAGLGDALTTGWHRVGLPAAQLAEVSIGFHNAAAEHCAGGSVDTARGSIRTLMSTAEYVAEKAEA